MTVLIAGAGKMGLSHAAIVGGLLGPDQVVVAEPSRLVRLAFKNTQIRTYSRVEEALHREHAIRAVIVATPTSTHYTIARAVLKQRRLGIFVEKPLCGSPLLSADLATRAVQLGVVHQVGFVNRYIRSFDLARLLVSSKTLGEVRGYEACMAGNVITGRNAGDSWRTDALRGGGCLNEYGPHLIDLCCYIFGKVSRVSAAVLKKIHSVAADDAFEGVLEHEDGGTGKIVLNWSDSTKRKATTALKIEFVGGMVSVDRNGLSAMDETVDRRIREIGDGAVPGGAYPVLFYLRGEEFSAQIADFLGRIGYPLQHVARSCGASFEDGCHVDEVLKLCAEVAGRK